MSKDGNTFGLLESENKYLNWKEYKLSKNADK